MMKNKIKEFWHWYKRKRRKRKWPRRYYWRIGKRGVFSLGGFGTSVARIVSVLLKVIGSFLFHFASTKE